MDEGRKEGRKEGEGRMKVEKGRKVKEGNKQATNRSCTLTVNSGSRLENAAAAAELLPPMASRHSRASMGYKNHRRASLSEC